MNKILIAFLMLAPWTGAFAGNKSNENSQLTKASTVINEIMRTPDNGIPSDLLNKAVCVGIVPSQLKALSLWVAPMDEVSWCAANTVTGIGARLPCSPWEAEALGSRLEPRPRTLSFW